MKFYSTPPASSFYRSAILIVASLLTLQCFKQPLEPVAPNWDVQLSIPVVDAEYFLKEALGGNADLRIDSIFYVYRPSPYNFDPISLGDTSRIKLNPRPTDTTSVKRLGTITIEPASPVDLTIPVSQIIPPITISRPPPFGDTTIVISDNDTTVINPLCIPRPPLPDTCVFTEFPASRLDSSVLFPANQDFDYIRVETGGIRLRIENKLPLQAIFAVLKLVNRDRDTITAFPPLTIAGRGIKDTLVNFPPGTKLTDSLTAVVSVSSPVTPLPVTFLPGDGISFRVEITTLTSNEAKIRIPAIPLADIQETQLIVDDSTFIRRVEFFRRPGGAPQSTIRVSLQSTIGAGVGVRFKFRELVHVTLGDTFQINTIVPARGLFTQDIVLPDWAISAADSNNIHYEVQMFTLQASAADTIFSTDGVSVRIQLLNGPFYLKSIQGRSKPFAISIDKTIDLPQIRLGSNFTADSIQLSRDTLLISLGTAAGHPIDINARIIGLGNNSDTVASIRIPPSGSPDPNAWRFRPNAQNQILLTGGILNDFLRQFPGRQPKRLVLRGDGIFNPIDVYNNPSDPDHIGAITVDDSLRASASFLVPLQVAIYNGEFRDTVSIGDTTEQGTRIDPNLLKSILEGNFFFRIQNTIPVNLKLRTEFLNQAGAKVLVDSVTILDTPALQTPVIRLTKDKALKFNESSSAIIRLFLGTGSQPARFDTTQSVNVRMYANLKFNINPSR